MSGGVQVWLLYDLGFNEVEFFSCLLILIVEHSTDLFKKSFFVHLIFDVEQLLGLPVFKVLHCSADVVREVGSEVF